MTFQSRKTILGLKILLVVIITLVASEIVLRYLGFMPGVLVIPKYLKALKIEFKTELRETHEFITDSLGIIKFNSLYFDTCQACPKNRIFNYFKNTEVNQWGFREINGSQRNGNRTMLLGDSITWGFLAEPIDSSFANALGEKGYTAYNFGIPATDVVQYEAIASNYLDIVKPSCLIVNFYTNDFVDYDKKVVPYTSTGHFLTDFGWLPRTKTTNDSVIIFHSAVDSRNSFCEKFTFGKYCTHPLHVLLGKFVVTTYAGRLLLGQEKLDFSYTKVKKNDITIPLLLKILELCKERKINFFICAIPEVDDLSDKAFKVLTSHPVLTRHVHVFKGTQKDYGQELDSHFNNFCHHRYAGFIDSLIRDKCC